MKNRLWITGSNGLVGSSLARIIADNNHYEILSTSRKDFDQTQQSEVKKWVSKNRPDTIIITSALVGGIHYNNSHQSDFLYENAMINLNVIQAALENNVKKIVFLGASCMYPKEAPQPYQESSIMTGEVEPTNQGYAVSKILGLKYIESINKQYNCNHTCIIPAATYGPNDSFDESKNHVIPALIKKIHNAKINGDKEVVLWGTGNVMREFIYIDDFIKGIIHILENYKDNAPINLGSGFEVSIIELANIIASVIGYEGQTIFDPTKPDGMKRKILDSSKIQKLGWKPKTSLYEGIEKTYREFLKKN
ncbi:MAG: GDP-L-fucose synthase [Pseudomonadota bacterium]|nr:GDP-L-fucose synthase [Pseudomonadota bacterium]